MSSPLDLHRDEGPLAGWLARRPGPPLPLTEVVLLVPAVGVVLAVLAAVVLGQVGQALVGPGAVALAWLLALAARRGRATSALSWGVPALLRLLEYAAVVLVAPGHPGSFALLAVLAYHHYDIVYRTRLLGSGPPPWVTAAAGGWSLRLPLLAAAAAVGGAGTAVVVLAVLVAVVVVPASVRAQLAHRT